MRQFLKALVVGTMLMTPAMVRAQVGGSGVGPISSYIFYGCVTGISCHEATVRTQSEGSLPGRILAEIYWRHTFLQPGGIDNFIVEPFADRHLADYGSDCHILTQLWLGDCAETDRHTSGPLPASWAPTRLYVDVLAPPPGTPENELESSRWLHRAELRLVNSNVTVTPEPGTLALLGGGLGLLGLVGWRRKRG